MRYKIKKKHVPCDHPIPFFKGMCYRRHRLQIWSNKNRRWLWSRPGEGLLRWLRGFRPGRLIYLVGRRVWIAAENTTFTLNDNRCNKNAQKGSKRVGVEKSQLSWLWLQVFLVAPFCFSCLKTCVFAKQLCSCFHLKGAVRNCDARAQRLVILLYAH